MNAYELSKLILCDLCGAAVADEYRHRTFHQTLDVLVEHFEDVTW